MCVCVRKFHPLWCVCVHLHECIYRRGLSGHCQHRHHDPSHLGTAYWQLISRNDSGVRSQVPSPLPTPSTRQVHLILLLPCCNKNYYFYILEERNPPNDLLWENNGTKWVVEGGPQLSHIEMAK